MTTPLHSFARRGTVIVASLATAALALSVSPASAAEAGHISGTVGFADSAPMDDDTYVTAYQYNEDVDVQDWDEVGEALVQLDGTYDIPGLDAGTYRVGFENVGGNYLTEYYVNSATVEGGTDVPVASTGTTPDVDATLAVAAHISGVVTDEAEAPIENIMVVALDPQGDHAATAFTDVDGGYELSGLAAGDYALEFSDYLNSNYVTEYYDNEATVDAAEPVTVGAGETVPGTDAVLTAAAHIVGTITGDNGAIESAYAQLYKQVAGEWEYVDYQGGGAFTDELGHYELSGLAAGSYRLEFDAGDDYVSEFYENAATVQAATSVPVDAGDTETVDAYLDLPSSITGTMTSANGDPTTGTVYVSQGTAEDSTFYTEATTEPDGTYVVDGLAAGSYIVQFEEDDTYFSEFWEDTANYEDATPVVVGADGAVTDSIDAVMDDKFPVVPQVHNVTGPTISGTPQVGSTLTGNPGTWDQPGTTFEYYWETYAGQSLASGQTYVPTAANVGDVICMFVVGSAPGFASDYAYGDCVGPVTAAPVVTPPVVVPPVVTPPVVTPPLTDVDNTQKPKVQGAKKVGSTLKAKVASWIPAGATVKYQWLVNGKPIKKATKAKLKVTGKLKGKKVSVKVIATSAGSLPVTVVTKVGKIKP